MYIRGICQAYTAAVHIHGIYMVYTDYIPCQGSRCARAWHLPCAPPPPPSFATGPEPCGVEARRAAGGTSVRVVRFGGARRADVLPGCVTRILRRRVPAGARTHTPVTRIRRIQVDFGRGPCASRTDPLTAGGPTRRDRVPITAGGPTRRDRIPVPVAPT